MYAAEVDHAMALPVPAALTRLATVHEGQWFERKSGRIQPRDLAIPMVAFANAEGGCIVVGIHDGIVDGVPTAKVNALRQTAQDFTMPVVRMRCEELPAGDEVVVLLFWVDPGERVHETSGHTCYLRVGDESRKLGFAQRQELEYDRGTSPYDGTPVDAGVGDLDPSQAEDYRAAIGSSGVEEMLRARSLMTRDGRLTVAALLLFADRPQQTFPHALVRVLRYTDTERGTGSRQTLDDAGDIRCEGSLPAQIHRASAEIERLLPRRRVLGESGTFGGRPIVPRDAWLEGLVNAVLHRSYSVAGDHIRVEIFPDRLEITSPGRFPGLANPTRPLEITRYARNPRLARVLSDLGLAQELGEGIRRIFAEMQSVGLTAPVYAQSSGAVRLVLSSANAIPADVLRRLPRGANDVLNAMRRAGRPLGTGQVAELAQVARPTAGRHLQALRVEGLVEWDGESVKDPRATWRLL